MYKQHAVVVILPHTGLVRIERKSPSLTICSIVIAVELLKRRNSAGTIRTARHSSRLRPERRCFSPAMKSIRRSCAPRPATTR